MNRVTLFLVVIVASLIVGGFIGWHSRKSFEPVYDWDHMTNTLDSLRALNTSLLADADSLKAVGDSAMAAANRMSVKYVTTRAGIPTASDSALANIILWRR